MADQRNEKYKYNQSALVYFSLIFICLCALLLGILFWIESSVVAVKRIELMAQEQRIVTLEKGLMGKEFNSVLSDIDFLSETYRMKMEKNVPAETIASEWQVFSDKRKIYDQIRFINVQGDETIRINYHEGGARIVPASSLQNKKAQYYFKDSISLEQGHTYISKLDLNVEGVQIERPLKPMIRFSSPVYDHEGTLQGIIVLNYSAKYLLEDFRKVAKSSQGSVYLLNASGYWLSSDEPDQEWAFMYAGKDANTFRSLYADEWNSMSSHEGSQATANGLFTHTDVVMAGQMVNETRSVSMEDIVLGDGNWKIVSYIDASGELGYVVNPGWRKMVSSILRNDWVYVLAVAFISGIISLLVSRNRLSMRQIRFHSEYDGLTKVLNRRAGFQKLSACSPDTGKICLCYTDINGLKEVNDNFGHDSGDELILTVVNGMKSTIRESDYIVRMGGDEFLIVFIGSNKEAAEKIWKRILEGYERINKEEDRHYQVSVSHGIVEYEHRKYGHLDEIIKIADDIMYEEKRIKKQEFSAVSIV